MSLHDPTHFGGPELTGTSLFAYGMAWGVRKGALVRCQLSTGDRAGVDARWPPPCTTMASSATSKGRAKQPSDGQPVTFDKQPNYEDFGLGCFLLGGSEVARLASH